MFATRFDPNAVVEDVSESTQISLPLKRRRVTENDESEDEEQEPNDLDDYDEEVTQKDDDDLMKDEDLYVSSSGKDSTSDSENDEGSEKQDQEGTSKEQFKDFEENTEEAIVQEHKAKHLSIVSRFTKSISKSQQTGATINEEDANVVGEQHDLIPLPQPELPKEKKLSRQPTAKTLDWLSQPLYISPKDEKPFDEFPLLNPKIKKNLQSQGFINAFATQIKTLEMLLPEITNTLNPLNNKGDVLVNAATGSGKTLAYSIPVVQSLCGRLVPKLRAVIIVPTKPLIQQVHKTVTALSKGIDLNIVTLGGGNFSINEETEKFTKSVPDILVTTPGRFVEHLNLKSINLKSLRFLIIDEADRLLNQSFQDWLNVLFSKLEESVEGNDSVLRKFNRELTKMIFSATLTTDSGKLTSLKFNKPRLIIVNDEGSILTNDKIFTLPFNLMEYQLRFSSKSSALKPLLLLQLLTTLKHPNALIFTKSNESALRLTKLLKILVQNYNIERFKGDSIANINSELSNSSKSKILQDFTKGDSIKFLVSTDLIARGIDILSIKNVINYDLPNSSREYVHRVGRTARAGNDGNAYSFVIGMGEEKFWNSLNLDINRSHDIKSLSEFTYESVKRMFDDSIYGESLKELEKHVFNK